MGGYYLSKINLPDEKRKSRSWHGDFIRLDLGPSAILRFSRCLFSFRKV